MKQFHPTVIIHKDPNGRFQPCIHNAAGEEPIAEWQPDLIKALDAADDYVLRNIGPNHKIKFKLIRDSHAQPFTL